ncbi:HlyD family type I secretion periplasmic adaptor subunit [Fretibacter rubidus]|uniref:HlyD family type I secretion periplasmic adaptor subunit n=1 Tax=Fretibacter rubidus TaxID=570162 RepID=UPI00352A007E
MNVPLNMEDLQMSLNQPSSKDDQPHKSFLRIGYIAIAMLAVAVVVWTFMPIQGAVIASGSVVVETKPKVIQHLDGGIIAQIPVKDGDLVKQGDVLMRLDPTVIEANQDLVSARYSEAQARVARLEAERDNRRSIAFPDNLLTRADDPIVAEAIDGQTKLFNARRRGALGLVQQLQQRIAQSQDQIDGLNGLIASKAEQSKLIANELVDLREGVTRGVVPRMRVTSMEREQARIQGDTASHYSEIARIRNSITELETQILQLRKDRLEEVLSELRQAQTEKSDLREQLVTATDQAERIDVLSPVDGAVHNLSMTTIGGVVAPGMEIMQIIPLGDKLIVEAQVQVADIDQIYPGQIGNVRLSAFNARRTPELKGTVLQASPDRLIDPVTGAPYFAVRIEIPQAELDRLGGLNLVPGMPAEIFLQTEKRSVMDYILRPAIDAMSHGLREE